MMKTLGLDDSDATRALCLTTSQLGGTSSTLGGKAATSVAQTPAQAELRKGRRERATSLWLAQVAIARESERLATLCWTAGSTPRAFP